MNSLPVLQSYHCIPRHLRLLALSVSFAIDYVVIRNKDNLLLLLFSTVSRE